MKEVAARSKLFHAIVVVGLSSAAGCGGSGQILANEDAGHDASGESTADAAASEDAPATADSPFEIRVGADASEDAGKAKPQGDASDAAIDCGPLEYPNPAGGCWPIYV
jgi:hypothetical protein